MHRHAFNWCIGQSLPLIDDTRGKQIPLVWRTMRKNVHLVVLAILDLISPLPLDSSWYHREGVL